MYHKRVREKTESDGGRVREREGGRVGVGEGYQQRNNTILSGTNLFGKKFVSFEFGPLLKFDEKLSF